MRKLLNISVDDVSPHPLSSIKVIDQCRRVLDIHPSAKFTLFVPTAYWRTIGYTATSEPLRIDRFTDFCEQLRALPRDSFELGYHGCYHGIPGRSNNDEFQHASFEDACKIIDEMMAIASKAGLFDAFKGVVRPPAWRMSPASFDAFESRGISTFALSPDDYAISAYRGAQEGRRVVYYNCCPPDKPLQPFPRTEIVYHACEWDRNFFSDDRVDELVSFLASEQFEYVFIGDLA